MCVYANCYIHCWLAKVAIKIVVCDENKWFSKSHVFAATEIQTRAGCFGLKSNETVILTGKFTGKG